ncbi:MAG: hypothetical protein ACYTG3_15350 [Planctomycetota bacterium]|jgi:hypothetical protein
MKTWLTIALGFALLACGTTNQEKQVAKREATALIGLGALCDDINAGVQRAARRMTLATEHGEIRRNLILWQLHTMQNCRRTLQLPDPRWAFLDLWTMTYQQKLYVEGEPRFAKKIPAAEAEEMKSIASEALDKLLEKIGVTARRVLTPSQFEQVREAARLWAEQNPIEGDTILARPSPSEDPSGAFQAILGVPAGVFSFGGGVKETAMAVEDVAIAAHHAVGAVEALPQTVRWQTELLLYALDEDPTMRRLFRDADQASDALESVAATVEKLPDHVRQTIRDVEATQPEFRKTIAEGRGVVEQANLAVERVGRNLDKLQETLAAVKPVSANTKDAGQAWERAFEQLNLLANPPVDPNAPPKPDAPPFDIKDAAKTAEWATKAAGEVKETVVELRQIVEGEGIDQRLAQIDTTTQSALDRTVARAEDLIDRLMSRAIIVIVVFFVALLGYRFAAVLVPRREE